MKEKLNSVFAETMLAISQIWHSFDYIETEIKLSVSVII